jgi:ADP-heptose:LPS heptosyltransferase
MTKANYRTKPSPPRRILLLKGHSAGIGDLLRSSAAWRALRQAWPSAELHLWFLSQAPGSAAEELIAQHPLLASFAASDKRTRGRRAWQALFRDARAIGERVRPDLVIDCEPNGLRTSLLTWYLRRRTGAFTVGIAQVPLRRWFYQKTAPSTPAFARQRGLPFPLEYTERDFAVLAALGIERHGTAIELRETSEGRAFRTQMAGEFGEAGQRPILGLNIGCGTPDAVPKRPSFDLLAALVVELQRCHGFALLLTGARYEQAVNREFLQRLQPIGPVLDLAGRTTMLELTGAIAACRLFISSDSGPYHMAVALRVPTLALFNTPNPQHYHRNAWTDCLVAPDARSLPAALAAAERLRLVTPPPVSP